MPHDAPTTDAGAAHYASYVVRVWRHRPGGLPVRVDIEHVQSGHHLAADPDVVADLVARLAAPFPTGAGPPPSPADLSPRPDRERIRP